MRLSALALLLALVPACPSPDPLSEEAGFRRLRQDFHVAKMTGDYGLMRSLWTDDAVLTTENGATYVGADAIADFLGSNPNFGKHLVLTSESSWRFATRGTSAEYGFESISVDVGGSDPTATALVLQGSQNPAVEIVGHTHATGVAVRVGEGRYRFREFNGGNGPLPRASVLAQEPGLLLGDEVGFRRMRETFHLANIIGDRDLMRSVWADDAVFVTGGGAVFEGGDAIADFFAAGANFGRLLVLTPESSSRIVMDGDIAEYGFECISIDVGGNDPRTTDLCTADGSQNPVVEIVRHTHSTGFAVRVEEGRWQFQEFNGGGGPLPPAPE